MNAIVTGATKGIGRAIVEHLATANYNVAFCARNQEEIEKFLEELKQSYPSLSFYGMKADMENISDVKDFADFALKNLGPIGVLVNNAGITRDRSFRKMSMEEWNEVIQTNLSSAFNTCQLAIPDMIENKFGRIINISSVIGQSGGFGQTNYAAAKAGLIGFSKSLALETAKYGVTVNNICPGFIGTEMVAAMPSEVLDSIKAKIPMNRLGNPSEIAKGVRFLAESAYVTGQCININGGLYM